MRFHSIFLSICMFFAMVQSAYSSRCYDQEVALLSSANNVPKIEFDGGMFGRAECGWKRGGNNIIDQFHLIRDGIKFGGKRYDYVPLLLTDKIAGAWSCHKKKVRIACVNKVANENGHNVFNLSKHKHRNDIVAKIIIKKPDIRISNYGQDDDLFIIPLRDKRGKSIVKKIEEDLKKIALQLPARCKKKNGEIIATERCKGALNYYAERKILERLRILRRARFRNQEQREKELQDFITRLEDRGVDTNGTVFTDLFENELGKASKLSASPYELSDAILGKSGLTFGPRQWDIAVNDDARRIFTAILGDNQNEEPDFCGNQSKYSNIQRTTESEELKHWACTEREKNCLMVPGREWGIQQSNFLYQNWRRIDEKINDESSRQLLVEETIKVVEFYENMVRRASDLIGDTYDTSFARYLVDVDNHMGCRKRKILQKKLQEAVNKNISEEFLFSIFIKITLPSSTYDVCVNKWERIKEIFPEHLIDDSIKDDYCKGFN